MRSCGVDVLLLCLRRATAVVAGALFLSSWQLPLPALAAEPAGKQQEFSVGVEAARHAWSLYSGVTLAPFGSLGEDGWRLRAVGGYGAYSYSGLRAVGVGSQIVKFRGTVSFADLLLGYHQQVGPLTLKLYAGAMATQHLIDPVDPEAQVQGEAFGAKAVLETWWTVSEQTWASLDLSYGSVHESYWGRLRLGWRLVPVVSLGLEASGAGNSDGDAARLGGFLRYEWDGGEVSASAGLMSDWAGIEKIDTRGAYATIAWMSRF